MQELFDQLQSPAWWIGGVIIAIAGNLAWVVLVWLHPHVFRNAVPVARGMVYAYAAATAAIIVYCTATAPPGWHLYPGYDDAVAPLLFAAVSGFWLLLVAFFGPGMAQLITATVFSCWAGFIAYGTATAHFTDPGPSHLWTGLFVYAQGATLLVPLVSLPFLPFIWRAAVKAEAAALGKGDAPTVSPDQQAAPRRKPRSKRRLG